MSATRAVKEEGEDEDHYATVPISFYRRTSQLFVKLFDARGLNFSEIQPSIKSNQQKDPISCGCLFHFLTVIIATHSLNSAPPPMSTTTTAPHCKPLNFISSATVRVCNSLSLNSSIGNVPPILKAYNPQVHFTSIHHHVHMSRSSLDRRVRQTNHRKDHPSPPSLLPFCLPIPHCRPNILSPTPSHHRMCLVSTFSHLPMLT